MEVVWRRQWGSMVWLLVIFQIFFPLSHCSVEYSERNISSKISGGALNYGVHLVIQKNQVEINNGIVQITVSRPTGNLRQVKYQGLENLLDSSLDRDERGYWDCAWEDENGGNADQGKILGTKFEVVTQNDYQVEVSFKKTWNPSDPMPALNVDKRYVMLRGSSGFYTYAIYERYQGWPGMYLGENRVVLKLSPERFQYMAISDTRQRIMPTSSDRQQGEVLAYPEAVLLKNPRGSNRVEEVDDKYQYSSQSMDDRVHGWISLDSGVGLWIIIPSDEFRASGPRKQDLTCHVGPTCLAMFMSSHYSGVPQDVTFTHGETWKKVFGPVFIYLNSVSDKSNVYSLWNDAKQQMQTEVESWPYNFPQSPDFLKFDQRGIVSGHLWVQDEYLITYGNGSAKFAHVGLSSPGAAGSWEYDTKHYQFWTQTDEQGYFIIKGVVPGIYHLHAWVPGVMGNYMYEAPVNVTTGSYTELPSLVFYPPRQGPTLWEIGVPDRSAAEFYVPPAKKYINSLYQEQDMFRQYGLWERYGELYPTQDLVFTVGISDYTKDWFFAHVLRNVGNGVLRSASWQIVFDLPYVDLTATYVLRLELAAANLAEVQVRVNPSGLTGPHFTTGLTGRDNAIARHGIHGLQHSFAAYLPGSLFVVGRNSIFLDQPRKENMFQGVMYDYIRLEGAMEPFRSVIDVVDFGVPFGSRHCKYDWKTTCCILDP